MATIKDIARAAGVSHATVSNVLNRKGIVSAEKVKLVLDTAAAMGYRLNEAASSLRSGKARVVAVILPDTDSAAYDDLYRSIDLAARERGYGAMLRLTGNLPAAERTAIHEVLSARARYVVAVTSLSQPEEAYRELIQSGAELAFALRGQEGAALYGGFDMALAADEMARQALADGARRVGLMTNPLSYRAEKVFRDSLFQRLAGLPVQHVESVTAQYTRHAFSFFDGEVAPDAVITTDEGMARAVGRAGAYLGMKTPRIYTLRASRLLKPGGYACYSLNHRRLGTLLLERLMDGGREPLVLPGEGFLRPSPAAPPQGAELRMLSNDSPVARALIRLAPRFFRDTGVRLQVELKKTEEVTQAFEHPQRLAAYDLARMDMALLDQRARDCFAPVWELPLNRASCEGALLEGILGEYGQAEGKCYALPLDPSCHLLFYRKDLTDSPHFRRRYYEAYHEAFDRFDSYQQYARAAVCLDKMAREESAERRGALLTGRPSECLADLVSLSADGRWPALTRQEAERFVARRRALEEATLHTDGGWNAAVRCFAQGKCAAMIAHSNYVGYLAEDPLSGVSGRIGYALPPGRRPLLAGGVIGALASSPRLSEAAALMEWLYSPGARDLLALLSGCSPCRSAYENEEITDVYPWLSAVRQGLQVGVRRNLFPGRRQAAERMETERRIARLCAQAVAGALSPGEMLEAMNREALGQA